MKIPQLEKNKKGFLKLGEYHYKRYLFVVSCKKKKMTYEEIGRLLNLTKQRIYAIYRYGVKKFNGSGTKMLKNKVCYICDSKNRLVRHHIGDPRNHEIDNLMILCTFCHNKIHAFMNKDKKRKKVLTSITVGELENPLTLKSVQEKLEQIDNEQ